MTIDWNRPIEDMDGNELVFAETMFGNPDEDGDYRLSRANGRKFDPWVSGSVDGSYITVDADGRHWEGGVQLVRNVKGEAVMETKFKVGDRVRCIEANFEDLTVGKVYEVASIHKDGTVVVYDDNHDRSVHGKYEPVMSEDASNELTALRAFKAMALERYPDLEPKPETDEEAAARFEHEWQTQFRGSVFEAINAAIAWARANPRNAETKEG